jgi:hypothetical protein
MQGMVRWVEGRPGEAPLTPAGISSLPVTGGLPLSISFSTSCPELVTDKGPSIPGGAYFVRVCIAFTITSQTWSVLAEASAALPGDWHLPTSIRARAPFLGRTSHEN